MFVTNTTHPNGRSKDIHGHLSYFDSKIDRIDPPKKSEKGYDKKMQTSVHSIGPIHSSQVGLGHKGMGEATLRRHLHEIFPRTGICPRKEDYCDTCRSLEIELKRST